MVSLSVSFATWEKGVDDQQHSWRASRSRQFRPSRRIWASCRKWNRFEELGQLRHAVADLFV